MDKRRAMYADIRYACVELDSKFDGQNPCNTAGADLGLLQWWGCSSNAKIFGPRTLN